MKRIFAIMLALAMLTVFFSGCHATEQPVALETTGAETPSSRPTDGAAESIGTQNDTVEYQISDILAFPQQLNDTPPYTSIYAVRSTSELAAVYDGAIPTDKQNFDEAFFAEHSLVIASIMDGSNKSGIIPGTLFGDQDGVYHLVLDGYCPELTSPVCIYHQLVLVTDSPLDLNADIVLDYTYHVVTYDEFEKLFPES